MKYRLKDQTMQAKLDAISGGDFSLKLQEQVTPYKLTLTFVEVGFSREKGKNTRWFTATFRSEEIEEIPEYNPHGWNEWPDVTPPVDVPMRCEIWISETPEGGIFKGVTFQKTCLKWDGSTWRHYRDGVSSRDEVFEGEIRRIRFRPWVDPDEEDKE